jgi:hypothetical protein
MVNTGARLMKYTLIAEDTWDGSKTTREFEGDFLPDVLTEIELFLKGAGFVFNGNLDFVDDFAEPEYNEEWDTEQDQMYETTDVPSNSWPFAGAGSNVESGGAGNIHSQHFFDTERNK